MISILIADDHTIFRQGLSSLINNSADIRIVAELNNGKDAWEKIQEIQPDVAVLDISMPGKTGLQISELAFRNETPTRIILLTMHDDPSIAAKALKFNVKGYMLKDDAFDELLNAIHTVAAGRTVINSTIAEKLKYYNYEPNISKREEEVLKLIAHGQTNREIAIRLNISAKTVDTYRSRLMTKLNLHTVADVTKHAINVGLV